ncbi:hypothetical protein FHG87_024317 [Trinorchestia longiramus]|nr:hypothetical protein FHG87_024317 [Trinorchestia longiramus]
MLNLIRNAVAARQFDYCWKVLNQLQKYRIDANVPLIELLEEARTHAIKDLKKLEHDESAQAAKEIKERKIFLQRYNMFLRLAKSPLKNKKEDKRGRRPDVASMLL